MRSTDLITFMMAFTILSFVSPHAAAALYGRDGRLFLNTYEVVNSSEVAWDFAKSGEASRAWTGIGRLSSPWCTAFLVDAGNSDPASPAFVITNGHCTENRDGNFPQPGEIVTNIPVERTAEFRIFLDRPDLIIRAKTKEVVFASMTGMDLAVIEMEESRQELEERGLTFLRMATHPTRSGEPVSLVGIPQEGIPADQQFLRRADCVLGELVKVQEIQRVFSAFRHRCSMVGGASGSPLISAESGEVVGVTNTGTEETSPPSPLCGYSRPCEIQGEGAKLVSNPEENYASVVHVLAGCFDQKGRFDLSAPNCSLRKIPEAQ